MENSDGESKRTRERLLEAAGQLFARKGFRSVTNREIVTLAGANVAAVNYYFGSKEGLYSAVVRHILGLAAREHPTSPASSENASPEELLHSFIRSLLFWLLDDDSPVWHGKLAAREIIEPTEELGLVIECVLRPLHERLQSIVRKLPGAHALTDAQAMLCTVSIIGQCVFYYSARQVVAKLHQLTFDDAFVESLAHHITQFSMAGVKELAKGGLHMVHQRGRRQAQTTGCEIPVSTFPRD